MMTMPKSVLSSAIELLSNDALEQIAAHCETHLQIAERYCHETQDKIAFIKLDERHELQQLATYCRRILAIKASKDFH